MAPPTSGRDWFTLHATGSAPQSGRGDGRCVLALKDRPTLVWRRCSVWRLEPRTWRLQQLEVAAAAGGCSSWRRHCGFSLLQEILFLLLRQRRCKQTPNLRCSSSHRPIGALTTQTWTCCCAGVVLHASAVLAARRTDAGSHRPVTWACWRARSKLTTGSRADRKLAAGAASWSNWRHYGMVLRKH